MSAGADVQHPAWCRGKGCDAASSYTHRSPVAKVATGMGTRLEIYVEGGEAEALTPVLAIESRTCRCRDCDPRDLLVLNLAEARAMYAAVGALLDAVDTP